MFSLRDLGGKVPKTSLTTFQNVVKEPGLANLHAYLQSGCFCLPVGFLVLQEMSQQEVLLHNLC